MCVAAGVACRLAFLWTGLCLAGAVPETRRGSFVTWRTLSASAAFAVAATTTTCRLGSNTAVSAELRTATPTSAQQNHAFRTERPRFRPGKTRTEGTYRPGGRNGPIGPFFGTAGPCSGEWARPPARRRPRVRRETTVDEVRSRPSRLSRFKGINAGAPRSVTRFPYFDLA